MRLTWLRIARLSIVPVIIIHATFCSISNASESAPTRVMLGTSTKGGGFELFGQKLAEVINAGDSTVQVQAIATRGSNQNLKWLEQGKIDIGLVEGNAARKALDGIGRTPAKLKVLSVMYPNPGMFVVRADSPYHNIDDLKGKPIAFGTRASGLRILATSVLDGLGLSPESDFDQVILENAGEGPRLVLNQKVAALWGAGIGWPGFVKVARSPVGARFIAPSAAQVKQIMAKHPYLKTMSVPAGTYKGQTMQIDSLGLWSLILVRPEVPDEVAYRLVRAIHRGESELARQLKQGRYAKVQNIVDQVSTARLHPGVIRFLHEKGLVH